MPVSVTMPQLGESVTEGTVTRWLKKEGDRVEADEPLLEVSTDKVDTEIPSPASGTVRSITVAEDETVAVGAELAVIDADGQAASAPGAQGEQVQAEQAEAEKAPQPSDERAVPQPPDERTAPPSWQAAPPAAAAAPQQAATTEAPPTEAPPTEAPPTEAAPTEAAPTEAAPADIGPPQGAPAEEAVTEAAPPPAAPSPPPPSPPGEAAPAAAPVEPAPRTEQAAESTYVTPLVRKLAAEHDVDLSAIKGTGVGGRIRKQDVLEAARAMREAATAPARPAVAAQQPTAGRAAAAAPGPGAAAQTASTVPAEAVRGRTEKMSRLRQVIAERMVQSLQVSAQLTTVVEADVSKIAQLRERAKGEFEQREGVKLSFLPFFALATVEALKIHPKLNALIDTDKGEVTYHDVEHLGIAVDTDRGLLAPVIRDAGDLNIAGLARKIADLAERTRSGRVSPDELAGGTFTLTNTGSRGALFDTPIINQPQVAILGTGAVVKRPRVIDDPELGEVIAVRSMVYLALTYDHRIVDGADAARFLATVKNRLEEGKFEAALGLA